MKKLITLILIAIALSSCAGSYCATYGNGSGYKSKDRK